MTEPTDAELLAEWDRVSHIADAGQRRLACLRAVLAKWGQPAGEPAAWLHPANSSCVTTDPTAYARGIPLYKGPQPVAEVDWIGASSHHLMQKPSEVQAGAVPLDEARRLFDAGWKAAALFCDREDVVADGIIGFGACPQFEAAFSAAHGIKGGQHGDE